MGYNTSPTPGRYSPQVPESGQMAGFGSPSQFGAPMGNALAPPPGAAAPPSPAASVQPFPPSMPPPGMPPPGMPPPGMAPPGMPPPGMPPPRMPPPGMPPPQMGQMPQMQDQQNQGGGFGQTPQGRRMDSQVKALRGPRDDSRQDRRGYQL